MKKNHQPYVKWYSSDFLAGVRGLSASQIGIYTILINEMYERTEPLPLNLKRLAWQCGCTKTTFQKALNLLIEEEKIILKNDGLWNNRVEKEFKNRQKRSATGSDNANARWEKSNKINGGGMQTVCKRDATAMLIPETRNQKPDNKKNIQKEFEGFWITYGKHGSKKKALDKFIIVRKKTSYEILIKANKTYDQHLKIEDWKKKRHMVTWLNQEGWNDEYPLNGSTDNFDYLNVKSSEWGARIKNYKSSGRWHDEWGLKPDENGNDVPEEILRHNNYQTFTNNRSE